MPRKSVLFLAALARGAAAAKPDGTCGYQCTKDSECGGCGTAGKCSCPNGMDWIHTIACSCVSAPENPPKAPAADVADSTWPETFTATLDVWNYKDFSDKAETGEGKFYYSAKLGKTRMDWIAGKKGKQVWIGSNAERKESNYYATVGPVCLKFPIGDPGIKGKPMVGVEVPDWMKRCQDGGFAKYVGREQVNVGGADEWVDHWSCKLDYDNELTNQTIDFQNWHTLGLGKLPKGLPVRVTGGNSVPDPNQSPRMNSVWYSDFNVGDNAVNDDDFKEPTNPLGLPCVPLMAHEVEDFFGQKPTAAHVLDPAFHRRAAFLPHIKATKGDLSRARRPKPGHAFTGSSFEEAMSTLNTALLREKGLKTKSCGNFTVGELHEMQRLLFDARTPELDTVYVKAGDTRRMSHASTESLEKEQAAHATLHSSSPELAAKARDGACHEMVMWYIHHLSASAREAVKETLLLPLLPALLHDAPPAHAPQDHHASHARYKEQASCAVCHVTGSEEKTLVV